MTLNLYFLEFNKRHGDEMKGKVKKGRYVDALGTVSWYKDGKLHREAGPAIEWKDGTKEWWLNGTYHREDGPAVEWPNGTKGWWVKGKKHREDGPAIEWWNGSKHWYVNGVQHTEEEYNKWLAKKQLNEILHQTLEEKPSVKKVKI